MKFRSVFSWYIKCIMKTTIQYISLVRTWAGICERFVFAFLLCLTKICFNLQNGSNTTQIYEWKGTPLQGCNIKMIEIKIRDWFCWWNSGGNGFNTLLKGNFSLIILKWWKIGRFWGFKGGNFVKKSIRLFTTISTHIFKV